MGIYYKMVLEFFFKKNNSNSSKFATHNCFLNFEGHWKLKSPKKAEN